MSGPTRKPHLGGGHRSASVQQGPPADLTGFPEEGTPRETTWYREHASQDDADGGCWYFNGYPYGQAPQGRFDLTLPKGTCYLAETPEVAARERCGRFIAAGAPIPPGHYEGRVISAVQAPAGASRIANAADAKAAHHFQVTRELFSCSDYVLTTHWAAAFYRAGFDALLYEPRFGPGPGRAVALFSDSGPQPNRGVISREDLRARLASMALLPALPHTCEVQVDNVDADDVAGPR